MLGPALLLPLVLVHTLLKALERGKDRSEQKAIPAHRSSGYYKKPTTPLSDRDIKNLIDENPFTLMNWIMDKIFDDHGFDFFAWVQEKFPEWTIYDVIFRIERIVQYEGYPFPEATVYGKMHLWKKADLISLDMIDVVPDPLDEEEEWAFFVLDDAMTDVGLWESDQMAIRHEFYKDKTDKDLLYNQYDESLPDEITQGWNPVMDPPDCDVCGGK